VKFPVIKVWVFYRISKYHDVSERIDEGKKRMEPDFTNYLKELTI